MNKMNKTIKTATLIVITTTTASNALAYIDPGTATTIIGGSIWPFIVMVGAAIGGFFVKYFWYPIKNFFSKIFGVFKKKDIKGQ